MYIVMQKIDVRMLLKYQTWLLWC